MLALGLTSHHITQEALTLVLTLCVRWSFIASGPVACGRRPDVTSIFQKLRLPADTADHRRVLAALTYLRS